MSPHLCQHRARAAARSPEHGFTLVELLVSMTILLVIVALLSAFINGMTTAMQQGSSQMQRLSQAQRAFDTVRATLGEATLRPYYDYVDAAGVLRPAASVGNAVNWVPFAYTRTSELRFIAGPAVTSLAAVSPYADNGAKIATHATFFQVPAGRTNKPANTSLRTLLNTVGFYVEYGRTSDLSAAAASTGSKDKRFRLMMMVDPAEEVSVYNLTTDRTYKGKDWYTAALKKANVHLLAENVLAFVVRPKKTTGNAATPWSYFKYPYDSSISPGPVTAQAETQHQLPPVVEITIVGMDEANAQRLELLTGSDSISQLKLSQLFTDPEDSVFTSDLATLTKSLTAKRIVYRIFTTDVAIEEAKW